MNKDNKHIETSEVNDAPIAVVSTRLIPYLSSHNMFTEGYGRKCHIGYYEDGKPLCGLKHPLMETSPWVEVTKDWVECGLNSGEICKKCAKKALSIIEASENGC